MMAWRRKVSLACSLVVTLVLALHAPDVTAQQSAPSSDPSPTRLASAHSSRSTARRTGTRPRRRRRRLRREASLFLPQVTAAGIPRLHAKAAYVVDATTNQVLFQKNPDSIYSIASLTKLMTALVYFQTQPQFDQVVEITADDVYLSSRSHIRPHEEITVRDLLHAMLMASDNVATKAVVRSCGVPRDEFVRRMNALADSMNLTGTHFVEPTGLDPANQASAQAIATMLRTAASNPIVSSIMQKQTYTFASKSPPARQHEPPAQEQVAHPRRKDGFHQRGGLLLRHDGGDSVRHGSHRGPSRSPEQPAPVRGSEASPGLDLPIRIAAGRRGYRDRIELAAIPRRTGPGLPVLPRAGCARR